MTLFWDAPIHLSEIEATEPLADQPVGARYVSARVLVKYQGLPIGWLHVHKPGERIRAVMLEHLLSDYLGLAFQQAAIRERLAPVIDDATLPAISVVVCTRDRTESLARCLDSLARLDYPRRELIVVDNAPTSDATATLVARYVAAHPTYSVRYVREDRAGLDWARNRGLAESRHEIVAYTDDDVRVDRNWLRGIARGFADPTTQLVTGLVVPGELETFAQVLFEDAYGGMGKGFTPKVRLPDDLSARDRLGAHHLGVGANMALRRAWLEQLGGFDTALDVGTPSHGAGDLDIFHRTMAAGGVARYEPAALVWHFHRREMRALRRQLADNGRAFGVFLLTRWSRHERTRGAVVRYAFGTWLAWLIMRVPRRFMRRERMPLPLLLEEPWGALHAPWAWRATYRHDARLRALGDATPSRFPASADHRSE